MSTDNIIKYFEFIIEYTSNSYSGTNCKYIITKNKEIRSI